jgi:uncharacterized C2H2 Zn-finger protein
LKTARDWLRWDGGQTLSCERCGLIYKMRLPASLTIVTAICHAFQKDHRRCPKPATKKRVGHATKR